MELFIAYTPDDWEIKREDVVLENELGSGAFGLVYRGTWQMNLDQKPLDVAVKAKMLIYVAVCIGHVLCVVFDITDIEWQVK